MGFTVKDPTADRKSTVPFGKYYGEPAEVLLSDPDYIEWCENETDLFSMYPDFWAALLGGEPEDYA